MLRDEQHYSKGLGIIRSHFVAGHDRPETGKKERFRGEQPRKAVIYQLVFELAVFIVRFLCVRFQIGCHSFIVGFRDAYSLPPN